MTSKSQATFRTNSQSLPIHVERIGEQCFAVDLVSLDREENVRVVARMAVWGANRNEAGLNTCFALLADGSEDHETFGHEQGIAPGIDSVAIHPHANLWHNPGSRASLVTRYTTPIEYL